jgi:hypothetical protein
MAASAAMADKRFRLGLVMPLVGLLLVGACTPAADGLDSALRDAGFTRIGAPRDSIRPGTVILVTPEASGLLVDVVCWSAQAYPELQAPVRSPTTSIETLRDIKDRYVLEPTYADLVKAKVGLEKSDRIQVAITNAFVEETSMTDLVEAEGSRQEGCSKTIERLLKNGKLLYVVRKILIADVIYTVDGSKWAGLEAATKAKALSGLEAELHATRATNSTSKLQGNALSFGMYLEQIGPGKNLQFEGEDDTTRRIELHALSASARNKVTASPAVYVAQEALADR